MSVTSLSYFDWQTAAENMHLIRATEEAIARHYKEGKMRTPTHLSIGQESVAVGVCMALPSQAQVYSNHRCHAHYLAKGGSLEGLIAELYGKVSGCAGGWGGSMHLSDESVGFMGTSAIVGSAVPVAVGAAMAMKHSGNGNVSCVFMGDAGMETGQVYESLHIAGLWKLPILFIVEDNGLATQTPVSQRQLNPDNWIKLASILGVTGFDISHSLTEVFSTTEKALNHLPALVRVQTHRWYTHVGPELDEELGLSSHRIGNYLQQYREVDEVEKAFKMVTNRELIENENRAHIEFAFLAAENSDWPMI